MMSDLLWLLLEVALVAVSLFGLLALSAPESARRVASSPGAQRLERPIEVEGYIYRHHRTMGTAITVGAAMLLTYIAFRGDGQGFALLLAPGMGRDWAEAVVAVGGLLAWLGCLLALVVGVIVAVRPSSLKRVESVLNRWITPPGLPMGLGRLFTPVDRLFRQHTRAFGVVIFGTGVALTVIVERITEAM